MHDYPPEAIRTLSRLNASFRFVVKAGTLKKKVHKDDPDEYTEEPGLYCEVIDNTIGGDPYCSARGETEHDALRAAAIAAITAPKPKTRAQREAERMLAEAHGSAESALARASEVGAENEKLRAQMEKANLRLKDLEGILISQGKLPAPDGDTKIDDDDDDDDGEATKG